MNINFNSISLSSAHSFFKEGIRSLTKNQKLIVVIASIAFACLCAYWIVNRYLCLRASPKKGDDEQEINQVANEKLNGQDNISLNQKKNNEENLILNDGIKWQGEPQKTNIKHVNEIEGMGTLTYPDTQIIEEGLFVGGQLTGLGKRTNPNGLTEAGLFIKGKLDGPGTLTLSDGTVIDGIIQDNKLNGFGKINYLPIGLTEEGLFENGELKQGTRTFLAEITYKGHFKNGKLNGEGEITYHKKMTLKGHFEDDRLNGPGEILFADGVKKEGNFKNNRIEGEGYYTFEDGSKHKVLFTDDGRVELII